MNINCRDISEIVHSVLRNNTNVREIDIGCEITLPVLDPFNDPIQIYLKRTKEGYEITDFGEVIEKLSDLNFIINTPKRTSIFESIITLNGVKYTKGMLTSEINIDLSDFESKFIHYMKALSSIYNMEYLKETHIRLDFAEVVRQHLVEKKYFFIPNKSISLKEIDTKLKVDFLIDDDIILNTLHASEYAYSRVVINDIFTNFSSFKKYVPKYHRLIIYNDESPVSEHPRFNLLNDVLDIEPIPWSKRDTTLEEVIEACQS